MNMRVPKSILNQPLNDFHDSVQKFLIYTIKIIQFITINIQYQKDLTILKCRQNNF